jgi:hypothetical protein
MLLGGRREPTEETPSSWGWGHGWVDVLAFGHGVVLGPSTHVLDDGKGGADASSGGSHPFAEVVRSPLEAGWGECFDSAECEVQPTRESCCGLPLCGGFQRRGAPYSNKGRAVEAGRAEGNTMAEVVVHEVCQLGVGREWDS